MNSKNFLSTAENATFCGNNTQINQKICGHPSNLRHLRAFIILLTVLASACGQRQPQKLETIAVQVADIQPQRLNPEDIPDAAKYTGNFSEAYRYVDKTGENIVILAETEVTTSEDEDGDIIAHKAIYAHRFLKKNNHWEETWKAYHHESECFNYPVAEFVKGAFSVTDLDNDGVAEIWLVYISSCRGDFSPDKMFIRLHDNRAVYMMTGERILKFGDDVIGGEYTFDEKFSNSNTPQAFREYGVMLWEKYVGK